MYCQDKRGVVMTISVLLAEDHNIYRKELRLMLDITPGIHVMAETNNGSDALILCERLKPDVAVLDWAMSDLSGQEVTKQLAVQQPGTHIVILSMECDKVSVFSAFQNGACGFILKDDSIIQLIKAVYAAANGERYLSPFLRKVVSRFGIEEGEKILG
jgi:DNA-binding NarL/FixJ family response regulator